MAETVKLTGVLENGYGISPKLVMRDQDLSIEAKAIYAYMSSFAGNGGSAFPSISLACKDLNVSEKRFRKHRDQLIDKGYITIQRNKNNDGKFENNIYVINHTVKTTVRTKRHDGKTPARQNDRTNNNSSFNNNSYLIKEDETDPTIQLLIDNKIVSPGALNKTLLDDLNDITNNFGFENPEYMIAEAIKDAARGNGRTWKFVYNKLVLWRKFGVKNSNDLARYKEQEMTFNNKKPKHNKTKEEIDWDNL